jgi:hypothetical protein
MTTNKNANAKFAGAVFGAILIGVGVLFLLGNIIPYFAIGRLWPLFMLIPAAILGAVWIRDREQYAGAVLPITILLFFTGYFLWLNFTTWAYVEITWPNFLIGPGLGFVALYLATKKWEFMIPAFVLLLMAALFYSGIYDNTLILSLLLIAAGVAVLARFFFAKNGDEENGDSTG